MDSPASPPKAEETSSPPTAVSREILPAHNGKTKIREDRPIPAAMERWLLQGPEDTPVTEKLLRADFGAWLLWENSLSTLAVGTDYSTADTLC